METSTSLLEHLRQHPDEEGWDRLVRLYRPLILRWLERDEQLRPESEDLTQEILGVVWKELPRFERRHTGSFRAWLRRITVFRVKGHLRKQRVRPRAVGGTGDSLLGDLADDRSELSRVFDSEHNEHIVRQLLEMIAEEFSEIHVRAFRRHVLEEIRAAEVATELGVTVNVVLLAKSRILARLRELGKDLLE